MSIDLQECPVCYEKYDLTFRSPRILPTCGHTLCTTCLETLLRFPGHLKCPLDKKIQPPAHNTLDAFPPNYILLNGIEERSRSRLCPKHHQHELEFVCMDEKMRLCLYCGLFDDHKNHNIKSLSTFSEQMNQNVKVLEAMLKKFDSEKKETKESLASRKASYLKTLREKFEQLALLLNIKEKELELSIEAVFRREEERIDKIVRDGAKTRKKIVQRINRCQNLISAPDAVRLISGDHTDIAEKMETMYLKTKLDGMNSILDKAYQKFQDSLELAAEHLEELSFESEATCKMLDQVYQTSHQEFDKDLDLLWSVPIKSEAFSLEFCTESALKAPTILQIKEKAAANSSRLSVPFDISYSRRISSIFLKLSQSQIPKLTSEDLNTLLYVRSLLPNLESFSLETSEDIQMPFETFKQMFSALFWNPSCFRDVDLSSLKYIISVGNEEVMHLSEHLRKTINLTKISLSLRNLKIAPESLRSLLQSIATFANNLDELRLELDFSDVPEEIYDEILVKMEKIKIFDLSLNYTKFGDRALNKLATNVFKFMPDVYFLRLELDGTKITGNGIEQFLPELSNKVKDLTLCLGKNISIEDQFLEYFVRHKLEEMNQLSYFCLSVDGTRVSPQLKREIEEKMGVIEEVSSDIDYY